MFPFPSRLFRRCHALKSVTPKRTAGAYPTGKIPGTNDLDANKRPGGKITAPSPLPFSAESYNRRKSGERQADICRRGKRPRAGAGYLSNLPGRKHRRTKKSRLSIKPAFVFQKNPGKYAASNPDYSPFLTSPAHGSFLCRKTGAVSASLFWLLIADKRQNFFNLKSDQKAVGPYFFLLGLAHFAPERLQALGVFFFVRFL